MKTHTHILLEQDLFIKLIHMDKYIIRYITDPINFIEKRYLDKLDNESIIRIYYPVGWEYLVY